MSKDPDTFDEMAWAKRIQEVNGFSTALHIVRKIREQTRRVEAMSEKQLYCNKCKQPVLVYQNDLMAKAKCDCAETAIKFNFDLPKGWKGSPESGD